MSYLATLTLLWSTDVCATNFKTWTSVKTSHIAGYHPGSYKYVHILVSLRNTSFKILVARIPNPVAQKKNGHTSQNIHFFCLRHWRQLTRCAAPTEMHCPMPWLLKRSYAMLLVFILAFFDFAFLFLVSLSPVFVRFPRT